MALFDVPHALTPSECADLVALAAARGGVPAPVYGTGAAALNPEMRQAVTVLLDRDGDSAWLFDRLDALFARAAAALGLTVDPVFEPVQIVRYGPGDHFQMWHTDGGVDRAGSRLISASVELSAPDDYDGGRLEIAPARMAPAAAPDQGHATLFPSRILHRVTPVTRGARHALVAWTGLGAA